MASQGHALYELSTWMGHASIQTTVDNYTHLFQDEESVARRAAMFDAAFTAASTSTATVVALPEA